MFPLLVNACKRELPRVALTESVDYTRKSLTFIVM